MSEKVLIGMRAPEFTAESTFGTIRLADFLGNWVVLFSHPGDFTPVCTTEFIAFSKSAKDFFDIGAQLLGLSIDSNKSHMAWLYAIEMSSGVRVPFPVISDRMGEIAKKYGMISPHLNHTETVRNVYIIDPRGIIRAILIYPPSAGRNTEEILRLIKSLQATDTQGVVTPANWQAGEAAMLPAPDTYNKLLEREEQIENNYCDDWYLCYKNENV